MALTQKDIGKAFTQIKIFNEVGGTFEGDLAVKFDLYNSLGFEELSETIEATETNNSVEALDGAVDELVIILGKLQILDAAGFDVVEAINRVCENNLSKYIPVGKTLHYDPEFTKELNEKHQVYVIRDSNGKIRKPTYFKAVDLSDCVPSNFFKELL